MNKKISVSIIVILCMSSMASASILDDISGYLFVSTPIQKPDSEALRSQFYADLEALNTPKIISIFDKEMTDYGVNILKVRIYKTPWACEYCGENFYIVKGLGIVRDYPTNDREIVLTYDQVIRAIPFFDDEEIGFLERFQLYAIYKLG